MDLRGLTCAVILLMLLDQPGCGTQGDLSPCPRRQEQVSQEGRKCLKRCNTNADCRGKRKRCMCDDICGQSCINPYWKCKSPKPPRNGRIIGDTSVHMFGSMVQYSCNPGSTLIGPAKRICQGNRKWSGRNPTCTHPKDGTRKENEGKSSTRNPENEISESPEVYCDYPGTIENGDIYLVGKMGEYVYRSYINEVVHGNKIKYHCHQGFDITDGPSSATCIHGKWSPQKKPKCIPSHHGRSGGGRKEKDMPGLVPTPITVNGANTRKQDLSALYCGRPPEVPNSQNTAVPHIVRYQVDYEVSYSCINGYAMEPHRNNLPRAKCVYRGAPFFAPQWMGPTMKCIAISCGKPDGIANGKILGDSYNFDSNVQYSCNVGYVLEGPPVRICREDGKWSSTAPSCEIVVCPQPPRILHGRPMLIDYSGSSYTSNGFPFQSEIQYNCDKGYRLVGNAMRKCRSDATWDGDTPQCVEIKCDDPGILRNGFINGKSRDVNRTIIFNCHKWARLEGTARHATCLSDGSWSNALPKCLAECTIPDIFGAYMGNNIPGQNMSDGETLNIMCKNPNQYEFNSKEPLVCKNGSWSFDAVCQPKKCSSPPQRPKHGRVLIVKTEHGRWAKFECQMGYQLIGNITVQCLFGNWTGTTPECEEIYCGYPGKLQNGNVFLVGKMGEYDYREYIKTVRQGRQIRYSCHKGYFLTNGPTGATCIQGRWRPKHKPTCNPESQLHHVEDKSKNEPYEEIAVCPEIWSEHTRVEIIVPDTDLKTVTGMRKLMHMTKIRVECTKPEDYELNIENDTAVCVNGSWVPAKPFCKPKSCHLPKGEDGYFTLKRKTLSAKRNVSHGATVTYTCNDGYSVQGKTKYECQHGNWSPSFQARCVLGEPGGSCQLPQLAHGWYGPGQSPLLNISSNTSVDFYCSDAFEKNFLTIRCAYGSFYPAEPSCKQQSCGAPIIDDKVKAIPSVEDTSTFEHGTRINFECKYPGYKVKGFSTITCRQGSWNYAPPTCQLVLCDPITLVDNAVIKVNQGERDFRAGTRVTVICDEGYERRGAETLRCKLNGKWDDSVPTCVVKETKVYIPQVFQYQPCSYPANEHENVVAYANGTEIHCCEPMFPHGTEMTYRCKHIGMYEMIGDKRVTCVNGNWQGIMPECRRLTESAKTAPPIKISHEGGATAVTNDAELLVYPGTRLFLDCVFLRRNGQPRWTWTNSKSSYPEASWSYATGSNPDLDYRLTLDYTDEHDSGTFTCTTPYGHAHSIAIKVKQIDCPVIHTLPNMRISTTQRKLGTHVRFQCPHRLMIRGVSEIVCMPTEKWSHPYPICEPTRCPDLKSDDRYLIITQTHNTPDSMVYFGCQGERKLIGQNSAICLVNGTWSNPMPICEQTGPEIFCPDLKPDPADPDLVISNGGTAVGAQIRFSCRNGRKLHLNSVAVCMPDGRWSVPLPSCQASCGPPRELRNGRRIGEDFSPGATVAFACNPGYFMPPKMPEQITCLPTGQWSHDGPAACLARCEFPGLPPNGRADNLKSDYLVGETITFDCLSGFRLVGKKTIKCKHNGEWSRDVPTCRKL